jgi:hypothetical protein
MTVERVVPASPLSRDAWEAEMCDELLVGLTVPAEIRDRALAIVREDSEARRLLSQRGAGHRDEQLAMMTVRDAAIRALLPEAERGQFDANVARSIVARSA